MDVVGKYRTELDNLYLTKLRECFFSLFVQSYLYSVFKTAIVHRLKCICELRIVDYRQNSSLIINSWISVFDDNTMPPLAVAFRSTDNRYILEKVYIKEIGSFNSIQVTSYKNKELASLFEDLKFISPACLIPFQIGYNESLDDILQKLRKMKIKGYNIFNLFILNLINIYSY